MAFVVEKPMQAADHFAAPKAFTLTSGQLQALTSIEEARLSPDFNQFTLFGFPGTGKTTLISHYANYLREKGISVAVCAPTNKATRVLMKKIGRDSGIDFSSLQSLLGLRMDEKEDGTQDCVRKSVAKLQAYRVIIVDECSMVSTFLFNDICQHQGKSFIIFVGDPYQLPPVEDGQANPESKISPTFRKRKGWAHYTLSEVVRQAADNPIIGLATAIREAEIRGERFDPRRVHDFIIAAEDERLFLIEQEHVPLLGQRLITEARADQGRTDLPVRIVAWRNSRVQEYNIKMHAALGAGRTPEGAYFAEGESALAHQEFDGLVFAEMPVYDPHLNKVVKKRTPIDRKRIIISEEGTVLSIERGNHPNHPDIDSWEISFLPEDEVEPVYTYVPVDQKSFQAKLSKAWDDYRAHKTQKTNLHNSLQKAMKKQVRDMMDIARLESQHDLARAKSTEASRYAWSIQKSHGKIRHAYASTAHKAQGSTWDTTIVDLADLNRMPDDHDYNRALYVAITRSSGSLVIAL